MKTLNEEMKKIKHLFNYKKGNYIMEQDEYGTTGTYADPIDEFSDTVDKWIELVNKIKTKYSSNTDLVKKCDSVLADLEQYTKNPEYREKTMKGTGYKGWFDKLRYVILKAFNKGDVISLGQFMDDMTKYREDNEKLKATIDSYNKFLDKRINWLTSNNLI